MAMLEALPRPATRGATRRPQPFWRRRSLLFGVLALLVGAVVLAAAAAGKTTPKPAAPVAAPPALSARGTVEPVAQASVATISGGVVRFLGVRVGQTVEEGQRIADINAPAQMEILVAPWSGTIMGLGVHRGDTVMPGAIVATLGDLSRYQVRTTDVDEYLIGQIHPGQPVSMTVEALEGRRLQGTVETVALVRQASSAGVASYPVVIQLSGNDPDLRPGMTARVVFSPRGP